MGKDKKRAFVFDGLVLFMVSIAFEAAIAHLNMCQDNKESKINSQVLEALFFTKTLEVSLTQKCVFNENCRMSASSEYFKINNFKKRNQKFPRRA